MYSFCESLVTEAESHGLHVTKIEGSGVNFRHIEKRIDKIKPSLIVFNGHGSDNSLFDNSKREFVNLKNSHIFKNSIPFIRACNALAGLGKEAVEKGCKSFIGYKSRFWLPFKHGMESRPLQDYVAEPVVGVSNAVVIELIKGKTVRDSVDKSHNETQQLAMNLLFSEDPYSRACLKALIKNDNSLGFEGNPDSKLT